MIILIGNFVERFSNLRQRRAELRAADAEGVSDRPARGHMRTPSGGGVAHMRVSRPPSALHSSAINPNEKGSAIASAAPINSEAHERLLAATVRTDGLFISFIPPINVDEKVAQTLAMLADSTFDFILQSGASLRVYMRTKFFSFSLIDFISLLNVIHSLMAPLTSSPRCCHVTRPCHCCMRFMRSFVVTCLASAQCSSLRNTTMSQNWLLQLLYG